MLLFVLFVLLCSVALWWSRRINAKLCDAEVNHSQRKHQSARVARSVAPTSASPPGRPDDNHASEKKTLDPPQNLQAKEEDTVSEVKPHTDGAPNEDRGDSAEPSIRPFERDQSAVAQERRRLEVEAAIAAVQGPVVDVTELIAQTEAQQLAAEEDAWRRKEEERVRELTRQREEAARKEAAAKLELERKAKLASQGLREDTAAVEPSEHDGMVYDANDDQRKENFDKDGEEAAKEETDEDKALRLELQLNRVKERVFDSYVVEYKKKRRAEALQIFKRQQRQKNGIPQAFPEIQTREKEQLSREKAKNANENANENANSDSENENDFDDLPEEQLVEKSFENSEELEDLFERTVWDIQEEEIDNLLHEQLRESLQQSIPQRSSDQNHPETTDSHPSPSVTIDVPTVADLKAKGNAEFRAKNYDEAASAYIRALQRCGSVELTQDAKIVPQLLSNLAAVKLALLDYRGCEEDATDALEFDSTYVKALLRRFRAREAQKSHHDALADLKKALELDPSLEKQYAVDKQRIEKLSAEQFEREKEELMKQLKTFGNWALGKVGLSLDNFKLEQNPETGSYNIQFVQKAQ